MWLHERPRLTLQRYLSRALPTPFAVEKSDGSCNTLPWHRSQQGCRILNIVWEKIFCFFCLFVAQICKFGGN